MNDCMKKTPTQMFRANVVGVVLMLLFIALVVRLYSIQYFQHGKYSALADRQHQRLEKIAPLTGEIKAGTAMLAASFRVKSFYTDPIFVQDKDVFAGRIAEIVGMDAEEHDRFLKRMKRKVRGRPVRFVWIKRKVSQPLEKKLLALKAEMGGVYFTEEYRRLYPMGSMASHILGFRNIDGKPLEGMEYVLRRYLDGSWGSREYVRDARGNRMTVPGSETPAREGALVELTIDPQIQVFAEYALDEIQARFKPESSTVIILESRTGAILALANRPTYDPNRVGTSLPAMRKNHAVASIFEPGSIFKPFILAAALEAGVVSRWTRFECHHGSWRVAGRTIHDAHAGGYGELTAAEGLVVSSNICMAQIGLRLGAIRQRSAVKAFGFGQVTGCRLPGEVRGIFTPARYWKRSTTVSVSFGQEIATTPMQIAAAFNVFASGGMLLKPQIVRRITAYDGKVLLDMRPHRRRVISRRNESVMKEILQDVVDKGTGRYAQLKDHTVAGKTGTAQIARTDGPGYYEDKYVASFVCFAPVERPEITVLVTVRDPKGSHYGGVVAAPAAREIIRKILQYRCVPPSKRGRSVSERPRR